MIFVDELQEYPSGRWCHMATDGELAARQAIAQSLALQKRNKLAPPTKRNVAGIDAEAGEGAATGPMFEAVED